MNRANFTALLERDEVGAFLETALRFAEQAALLQRADFRNDLIILSSNYYSNNRAKRAQLISFQEFKLEKNRIINSLLDILKDFEQSELFEILAEEGTRTLSRQTDPSEKKLMLGLQVEAGLDKGRIYNLDALFLDKTWLKGGRLSASTIDSNDINLAELTEHFISRKHFTLEKNYVNEPLGELIIYDGHFLIEGDHNSLIPSANGIYVNGHKQQQRVLLSGDIIELGKTVVQVIDI